MDTTEANYVGVKEAPGTDRFANLFYVLLESYRAGRGRVLDPEQVKILVDAFTDIADRNQSLEGQLKEVEDGRAKRGRIRDWTRITQLR